MNDVKLRTGTGTLYRGDDAVADVNYREFRHITARSATSLFEISPVFDIISLNLGPIVLKPAQGASIPLILRRFDGKTYQADEEHLDPKDPKGRSA